MASNTMVRVKEVAKHPATHYTVGAGGLIAALMALLSPIVQAQPVKEDVKSIVKAEVKPVVDDVAALKQSQEDNRRDITAIRNGIFGDPSSMNREARRGIMGKLDDFEAALAKAGMPVPNK